jgi:2-iminobutanoate/2-iminopropanoate deaminase
MKKEIIFTDTVPSSTVFSQGIKVGPFLWTSGQIGTDVKTGNLINKTFEMEVEQCIANIENILKEAKYSLKDVIKVNIYLTDFGLFDRMNQIYTKYFSENHPARATVEVSKLAIGAKIEIEVVAFKEE